MSKTSQDKKIFLNSTSPWFNSKKTNEGYIKIKTQSVGFLVLFPLIGLIPTRCTTNVQRTSFISQSRTTSYIHNSTFRPCETFFPRILKHSNSCLRVRLVFKSHDSLQFSQLLFSVFSALRSNLPYFVMLPFCTWVVFPEREEM